jgi:flagellar assembly factor FliW
MEYALHSAYSDSDLQFADDRLAMSDPMPFAAESVVVENRFGTFRFEPEQMMHFAQGLIGFAHCRRFALASLPGDGAVNNFRLLQSLDEPSLSFIVWPTTVSNALLDPADVAQLMDSFDITPEALVLLHLVTIREGGGATSMTLNAKAPVVVDATARTGVQHVISGDRYLVRQPLMMAAG